MTTIQEKLSRIHNRRTLYEITATHPDGRALLVCYSAKSGHMLGRALTRRLESGDTRLARLAAFTGTLATDWAWTDTLTVACGKWTVQFSGRTQREAIISGELAFLGKTTIPVAVQHVSESQWETLVKIGETCPNVLPAACASMRTFPTPAFPNGRWTMPQANEVQP